MQQPTIHLNGTARATLVEQWTVAVEALRAAEDALCDAAPNGRDYYPQGKPAYLQAVAEYEARLARVSAVRREAEAMLESIVDAKEKEVPR